ncbi:BrnA antitoxin family protein [Methylobacterium planeticum]|uniref:BrnA antitoxin family protein n=1 Tax=Methylobacterium planeticum TaxID=2615211 RepID=A0A6N6MWN8_9HYPH|nr:BrnA antitoxin family protein [Methylobacterium planeticum]KAB1076091.1 hypothetical protein F6X51_00685 [Methylobacterium planeticum]
MAYDRSRRTSDPRQAAEAAFKAATTKSAAPAPAPREPAPAAVPGSRESVTLRLDSAVLEHFQKDGPGWQDRINAALKKLAGL